MTNTDNHYRAFDRLWFAKHQGRILAACNAPLVGRWTRHILGIDAPPDSRVCGIQPHCATWRAVPLSGGRLTTQFHSSPAFSKRIYRAAAPLWRLLHELDKPIERLNPAWGFGFSTLTEFNPDPHPETTSVDGEVHHNEGIGLTWAAIIAGAGTGADDVESYLFGCGITSHTDTDKWLALLRGITLFDTSAIGAGSSIISARARFYGYDKVDALTITPNLNLYASAPASNTGLVAGDFDSLGTTAFCDTPIAYGDWSTVAYNDFVLNANGLAAIAKAGITKFGCRNVNYDVSGTPPAWASNGNSYIRAVAAEGANPPILEVTYNFVSPFTPRIIVF